MDNVAIPDFDLEEKEELLNKAHLTAEKEIFKVMTPEEQKIAVRSFSDTILCAEIQRRLMGRKLSLESIGKTIENVSLTEL